MPFAAFLDEIPRPFWIAGMVIAFVLRWPIGLAILLFMLATGRIGRCAPGRWYNYANATPGGGNPGNGPWGGMASEFGRWNRGWKQGPQPQNSAFDDYRAETLRRLEEEHKEFLEYLERLRKARDKAEFDAFMAERGRRPPAPTNENV